MFNFGLSGLTQTLIWDCYICRSVGVVEKVWQSHGVFGLIEQPKSLPILSAWRVEECGYNRQVRCSRRFTVASNDTCSRERDPIRVNEQANNHPTNRPKYDLFLSKQRSNWLYINYRSCTCLVDRKGHILTHSDT